MSSKKPKVLVLDIETSPIVGYVWALFDQNIALNQIKTDWFVLSWSAKWLGDPESKIMYADQRNARNVENDKPLVKKIWKLIDQADVIVTQNGKRFDIKKLNARFVLHGLQPPSSFKHIDTLVLAKKHFAFTSNKLEYMTNKLCVKYKKLVDHKKFTGFNLWKECLAGNVEAWDEMKRYNQYDVLSLEELYSKLIPWDSSVNFNLYNEDENNLCKCGNTKFKRNGYAYTSTGKFQRVKCINCGAETRERKNLFSKEKIKSLRVK